jgi:hypothetical protein
MKASGIYVGRIGQEVLVELVERGQKADFRLDHEQAEIFAAKILDQVRNIRTPSVLGGARLRLVKK